MLVSVDELINYMSESTFSSSQREKATGVLAGVQAELEDYLKRPVELVQIRELLRSDVDGIVNVSVSPVVKVVGFSIARPDQTWTTPPVEGDSPYVPPPMVRDPDLSTEARLIDRVGPSWGSPEIVAGGIKVNGKNMPYVVEYIGGYDGNLDSSLKTAIMRVAAREMERDTDDTLTLRAGDAEMANESDDRQKGWTEDELKRFDRIRRRVVA